MSEQPVVIVGEAPRRSAGKVLLWILLAIVVLAIAAAGAVLLLANLNRGPAPKDVAEQYLDHLVDGDASAANAMLAPASEESADLSDRSMLTDDVLRAATERISRVSISVPAGFEQSPGFAAFDVAYSLAGAQHESRIELVREEGGWLQPGQWKIRTPFTGSRVIVAGTADFTLAGKDLPEVAADESVSLELYPAVYPIAAVDDHLFRTETDTVVVATDGDAGQAVKILPNDRFLEELQAQVDAFLDECAADTSWRPEGCPLSGPVEAQSVPVTWKIEKRPTVAVELDGMLFRAEGGTVSATYTPEGAAEPVTAEDPLEFRGSIRIDGDSLTIAYGEQP